MSGPGMPFVARGKDGAWNPKIGKEHAFFFCFFRGRIISDQKNDDLKILRLFWRIFLLVTTTYPAGIFVVGNLL